MNKLTFYTQTCLAIDSVINHAEIDNGASIEGLNSSIVGRIFVSVVDTFGQLLKTFGSNIVNIGKSIKRSELNEFVASNTLKTRTVDKIPYEKLVGVAIDCPANMKGTYREAVDTLNKVYLRLSALPNGKMVATSFREILNALNARREKDLSTKADAIERVMSTIVSGAKPAVDECMDMFDGKFVKKIDFDKAFLTMDEFVEVREALIDNEYRLQDVAGMKDIVTAIAITLKEITSLVENGSVSVNGKDLNNMSSVAKSIALIFDAYSMAVQRQMALEHNYVLCLNYLYANVK